MANWTSGWGGPEITGWDYVGQVNGASGVYLGNGWVLTAAHVGAGNFTVAGLSYAFVGGSATSITNGNGTTADLLLFLLGLDTCEITARAPGLAGSGVPSSSFSRKLS